jgi:hypothetical protein
MAGPWSPDWSNGYGPFIFGFPLSGKDYRQMAILAYTSSQILLFDYSEAEGFFVYFKASNLLYQVTTTYAGQWYGINGFDSTLVIVDNILLRGVW